MAPTKTSPDSANKVGSKRSACHSSPPAAKRGKPTEKEQQTIEQSMKGVEQTDRMNGIEDDEKIAEQIEEQADGGKAEKLKEREGAVKKREEALLQREREAEKKLITKPSKNGLKDGEKNAFEMVKSDTSKNQADLEAAKQEEDAKTEETATANSVIEDPNREAQISSSVLEKGLIYFFFRPRINTTDPQSISDIARSFIVLRPLPLGAKIGDGPLQDNGKARLLALPKKRLPKGKDERFLMFVEKAGISVEELREELKGGSYTTQTTGTNTTQPAHPFAEGIYALTSTGRDSHLAYLITIPEIGPLQKEFGVNEKGSFVLSVKNPEAPGPANATIDSPAKYPKDIQERFGGLRWSSLVEDTKLLDFDGAQVLVIGDGRGLFGGATQAEGNAEEGKEGVEDEMEKLGEEDHERVEHLEEDDPVFADLGLSSQEYSKIQTTW